jgi:hypothetical protein
MEIGVEQGKLRLFGPGFGSEPLELALEHSILRAVGCSGTQLDWDRQLMTLSG